MNIVVMSGNLGSAPRIYNEGADNVRCNFSIATRHGRRGENERTAWMDVVLFGKAAEFVAANAEKGQEVHVKGRLTPNPNKAFVEDGGQRYEREVWGIVADPFEGVTLGRKSGERSGNGGQSDRDAALAGAGEQTSGAPASDGDIPF